MKLSRFLLSLTALAGVSAVCGALWIQKRRRQEELFAFMDKDEQKSLEMTVPEPKESGLYLQFEAYTNEMIEDLKKMGMVIVQEADKLDVKWNGKGKFTVKRLVRQLKRLASRYHTKLLSLEYISPEEE